MSVMELKRKEYKVEIVEKTMAPEGMPRECVSETALPAASMVQTWVVCFDSCTGSRRTTCAFSPRSIMIASSLA